MDSPPAQTLSLPSLLLLIVLTLLLLRYFFFSSSSSSSPATSAQTSYPGTFGAGARGGTVNANSVEQVAQMFPQLDRRQIAWDLRRNGGSVAATTERVLGGGRLDAPPPSFQPPLPPSSTSTSASTSSLTSSSQPNPSHPDLITRYNLASKLHSDPSAPIEDSGLGKGKQGWSQNKNERQALLQRRREEMILGARRKMEERERVGGRVGES